MDDKFGPKVTSIFRAETSAKRYTWDKNSIMPYAPEILVLSYLSYIH